MKYDWIEIRKDYELHSLSYSRLSRIYGPHTKTIAYHARKEKWVKGGIIQDAAAKTKEYLAKSGAQINIEYDGYYEQLTGRITNSIKEDELNPTEANFHVSSLKTIRQERQEIRGEVTAIQQKKLELDIEKFEHKKYIDHANLEIRRDKKKGSSSGGDESDVEYVD